MGIKLELKNFFLLIVCIGFSMYSRAQNVLTVSGKVSDLESGAPISGVTVQANTTPGTSVTTTDVNGEFSITVQENTNLRFSSAEYIPQLIKITGREFLNLRLERQQVGLEQVVVVGYGRQLKKDLTGAVSVVNVSEMQKSPSGFLASQLQGRASGVTVIGSGRPGETPQVRVRGINTFGNNAPLYIVDGVPISSIGDINPNDIVTMQVLKDAGSASIYGSRAANGVIVVTTKSGKKGKTRLSYEAFYGTQVPRGGNVWNLLSPIEMAELKWMADPSKRGADPQFGTGTTPRLPDYITPAGKMEGEVDLSRYNVNPDYANPDDLSSFYRIVKANKSGTNWYDELFNPAPITSHNLSLSGGGDRSKYLFSVNYFNQQGTMLHTYTKRYSLRMNSVFDVSDRFRIGENIAFSLTQNPAAGGNAMHMAFRQQPIIPVYDINGNFGGSFGTDLGNALNPVAMQYRTRNNRNNGNRLLGSIYAEVDLLKKLTFRTQFGGELSSGYSHTFGYPEYENSANENTLNSYSESSFYGYNWTWSNTLQYNLNIADKHKLSVLAGIESYENSGRSLSGTTQSYFSFDPDFITLSSGSGTQTNASSRWKDALFSSFGRLDYSFMDKYLLGATLRYDGSSRFLNYQYGVFPSASAGWRLSKESFWNVNWWQELKLRGSFGVMGNQMNVSPDNAYTTFIGNRFGSYYDISGSGNSVDLGFQRGRIGNPDAKWEKNINLNLGFDAVLFKGRLEITAEYYRKDVKDLLYNPQLPGTSGTATAPYVNIGYMKNQGLDLSVGTNLSITKDLRFNSQLTFTSYRNEIVKISDDARYFDQNSSRFSGANIVRNGVGTSIGQFYGYQVVGFWNTQEEINAANAAAGGLYQSGIGLGRFKYADTNGDNRITAADRVFLGNPNPDFSYGLNVGLNYKQFDLGFFLFGVQGNEVWNQLKWWHDFYPTFGGAKSKTALYDSWTPERMNAKAPKQELAATFSTSQVPNSYYVEDGSYMRLKNIQLGYTFDAGMLGKYGISALRLYIQGANLFTITKYSGTDPEIPGGNTSFGIDEGIYPSQKQYLFGLNLSF